MSEINELLGILNDDKQYQAKIKELTEATSAHQAAIEAQGGINAISRMESEAQRHRDSAKQALRLAKDESDSIISEAVTKAEEVENTAKERAAKVNYLADQKLKDANDKESELRKLKVSIGSESAQLANRIKSFEKTSSLLHKRESEVSRKESILAQLKA